MFGCFSKIQVCYDLYKCEQLFTVFLLLHLFASRNQLLKLFPWTWEMAVNKVLSMKAGGLDSSNRIKIQAQEHMTITHHCEAGDG